MSELLDALANAPRTSRTARAIAVASLAALALAALLAVTLLRPHPDPAATVITPVAIAVASPAPAPDLPSAIGIDGARTHAPAVVAAPAPIRTVARSRASAALPPPEAPPGSSVSSRDLFSDPR